MIMDDKRITIIQNNMSGRVHEPFPEWSVALHTQALKKGRGRKESLVPRKSQNSCRAGSDRYSGSDLKINDVYIFMYVFIYRFRNALSHNKIIRLNAMQ